MNILLKSLAAIALSGPDARKFLQGQLTCDMDLLTPEQPLRGAHCNREGRVIALYDLLQEDERIILITQAALMPEAIKALKHYGMFSKITWEDLQATHEVFADSEGYLHLKSKGQILDASTDEAKFYYQKILKKEVSLTPETIGKFLPQELALSGSALSFTKGCYLGQEIIARVHYLGKLKRTLQLKEITVEEKDLDEVVVSVTYQGRCYALALLP